MKFSEYHPERAAYTGHRQIADLVDALFQQKRNPTNGRVFSYAQVSRALNGALQPSYIAKLRSGEIKNPGWDALLHLCMFFEVPAAYFFPELPSALAEERPEDALRHVLAALHLTAHQQSLVEALVYTFQSQTENATPREHPLTDDVL